MNEIQVGEYIRTPSGHIDIIVNKDKCVSRYLYNVKSDGKYITDQDIKLHSFNIVDLIEEGDYVNGQKVIKVDGSYVYVDEIVGILYKTFADYQIKSIVTKEQFVESEYKINEN